MGEKMREWPLFILGILQAGLYLALFWLLFLGKLP